MKVRNAVFLVLVAGCLAAFWASWGASSGAGELPSRAASQGDAVSQHGAGAQRAAAGGRTRPAARRIFLVGPDGDPLAGVCIGRGSGRNDGRRVRVPESGLPVRQAPRGPWVFDAPGHLPVAWQRGFGSSGDPRITMPRGRSVAFCVTDRAGDPVEGVVCVVNSVAPPAEGVPWTGDDVRSIPGDVTRSGVTDRDGRATVSGLPPDTDAFYALVKAGWEEVRLRGDARRTQRIPPEVRSVDATVAPLECIAVRLTTRDLRGYRFPEDPEGFSAPPSRIFAPRHRRVDLARRLDADAAFVFRRRERQTGPPFVELRMFVELHSASAGPLRVEVSPSPLAAASVTTVAPADHVVEPSRNGALRVQIEDPSGRPVSLPWGALWLKAPGASAATAAVLHSGEAIALPEGTYGMSLGPRLERAFGDLPVVEVRRGTTAEARVTRLQPLRTLVLEVRRASGVPVGSFRYALGEEVESGAVRQDWSSTDRGPIVQTLIVDDGAELPVAVHAPGHEPFRQVFALPAGPGDARLEIVLRAAAR